MTRDITSWPSGSTPNGWAALGPSGEPKESVRLRFWTFGPGSPSRLTISGAANATTIRKTMKPSDTSATRSWRSRRQNSYQGVRAGDVAADVDDVQRRRAGPTVTLERRRGSSRRTVSPAYGGSL